MRALVILSLSIACTGAPPVAPDPPVVVVDVEPEPPAGPAPLVVPDINPSEANYAATHVLISWQGATRSTARRSEPEARVLADQLHERAVAGADVASLAREWSDGPSGARGGSLGVYATGTMAPEFEKSVASVAPGEIGPLVRTEFGFHIVRRDAVRQVRLAQIQVNRVDPQTGRRRSEAELQERVLAIQTALQSDRPWADVARELSEDPDAATTAGDLGVIAPGQLPPAFERTAFALTPGQISEPVQTATGVHIIRRLP